MSDPTEDDPRWAADHRSLLERARRLEEARRVNAASAAARVLFHQGRRAYAETMNDFETAKQRAGEVGTPIDPRFQSWIEWEGTARDFHAALRAMYPPETKQVTEALARGDPKAVEWGLVFLEADPRCFRAGYLRERLLRYLARMVDRLGADDKRRLRRVTLAAVDDPWRPTPHDLSHEMRSMGPYDGDRASFVAKFGARLADIRQRRLPVAQRREFKWFCRLASVLNGDDLKRELEARMRGDDAVVARRASLMLGAIAQKQKPAPQA